MKQLAVEVTQEDIDCCISSCSSCPIALAIMRTLGSESCPRVFKKFLLIEGVPSVIRHTDESQEFVEAFDNGREVQPQTFTFEVPE